MFPSYGEMAPHKWMRFMAAHGWCEAHMERLNARHEEPPRQVCYDTLETVGKRERYKNLVMGPLRVFLETELQSVYEFNLEFSSSLTFKKDKEDMFDTDAV
ncbi:hypothetical protein Hanom_Chr09g00764601 [Helianthus anomalus]